VTGDGWRSARERKGITLRELARRVGISAPFQSDVEHGRRGYSPEVEAKVRAALDLSPARAPGPRCVVCEGPLKTTRWQQYDPSTGPMIYGPGSLGQYVEHESITCPRCGLRYEHAPATPTDEGKGAKP
jgi:transcriptional regulator with XRE-family HTH domain